MAQDNMSERIVTVVITLVVAGVLGVVGTALSGGALINALGGVQKADHEEQLSRLQNKIAAATPTPAGIVAAFDLPNGCPDGWTEFTDAAGRTIIGQGSGMSDENRRRLTTRKYRESGGEEAHKLTMAEMPGHTHTLRSMGTDRDDKGSGSSSDEWVVKRGKTQQTSSAGGSRGQNPV